jgi:hypothetical protein
MQRAFRVMSNENPVLYTDGGIAYDAANSWVSLPTPDEAKIGAMLRFYGYSAIGGYVCGIYTDGGNFVKLPNGSVTNYFTVCNDAIVDAQLDSDGFWRVTIVQTGINFLPYVSGGTTLDFVDGENYYIGYLSGDTTFDVSGGVDGSKMDVAIGWCEGSPTLDFSANIKMPADVSALLPITLETWRSYSMSFVKRGAYWTLQLPIQGPTVEGEDP